MKSPAAIPISIPLDHSAHHYARLFAAQQATPKKGKQVYLNTLAVWAVHSYLGWLSVPTRLDQGDAWHPGMRAIFDVADLVIPHLGRLECRPLLPGEETLAIPPEVSQDRIGYVAVQIQESLQDVRLLGFLPGFSSSLPPQPVPLHRLQPLDNLIDRLHQQPRPQMLSQWLQGLSSPDWQPLYSVRGVKVESAPEELVRVPSSVSRGKLLTWQQAGEEISIFVVIVVTPTDAESIEVHLQIYPSDRRPLLPAGLEVNVLNEEGITCMQAQAGVASDGIQLKFECSPQEHFSISIISGELNFTEQFII
jgi:hypothetical protein